MNFDNIMSIRLAQDVLNHICNPGVDSSILGRDKITAKSKAICQSSLIQKSLELVVRRLQKSQ